MGLRPQVRFQRSDNNAQTQRVLEDRLKPVSECPLISGRLIDVSFTAGANTTINHGLARKIRGWFLVRGGDPGLTEVSDDTRTLVLSSTGDGSCALWIF